MLACRLDVPGNSYHWDNGSEGSTWGFEIMTGRDSPYIALALIYMSEKDFPEKFHFQNLHFNVEMRDSGFTKWRFVQLFTTLTKTEKMLMNLNPLLSQTVVSLFGAMGMMLVLLEVVSIVQQQLFVFLRFVLRVAAETSRVRSSKNRVMDHCDSHSVTKLLLNLQLYVDHYWKLSKAQNRS